MTNALLPRRPYLVKAIYNWLLDNNLTPYLIADTTKDGVRVPTQFIRDDQIVLNIAPQAIGNFSLSNDMIHFNARFSGVPQVVEVPMSAVVALYARENGVGMMFEHEEQYSQPSPFEKTEQRQNFHVVSDEDNNTVPKEGEGKESTHASERKKPIFTVVE